MYMYSIICLGSLISAGTSESRRLFELSMNRGYLDTFIDKMLFYGSAGVGKTCTRNIVAGELPPDTRHSNPIATRPVIIHQMQASKEVWHKYTSEERMRLCAQISKLILGPELIEAMVDVLSKLDVNDEPSDKEESDSEQEAASSHAQAMQPAVQVNQQIQDHVTPNLLQPATSTQSLVDPKVLKVIHGVLDKLFQFIDECPETEEPLSYLHKLQIVDSGGQPQFHEVLPIFLRKISLIVFVIKLSEELTSHPTIEYFENGKAVGTPYKSDHTTELLVQQGLRSLHSHRSRKDKGDDSPQIVVLGTHKDEEYKSSESRGAKNRRLREMLLPTFKKEIIYHQVGAKEVIFPMNAKNPGQEEEDIAKRIRAVVTGRYQSDPRKLPLQWLVLEIILEEIAHVLDRGILTKRECLEIANRLHLNESALEAALMYLDELSLIFYYPDILPELVFTNPQVLLDKVSELVKVHHDLMRCSGAELEDDDWQMFFDHALVTAEFLSQNVFEKYYVESLFRPEDLTILVRKLFIFADFASGKYFVPSLLRMLCKKDVSSYRVSMDSLVFPLVLHFPDGPPHRGIFCSVVCFLTSPENHHPGPWKLKMPAWGSVTPTCLHRNCIQFTIPGLKTPCTVTFIDTFRQFELHVKVHSKQAASKVCPTVKHAISAGLLKANITLGYTNSTPLFAFLCPCGSREPHPATIGDESWICTFDEGVGDDFSPSQLIWLEKIYLSHFQVDTFHVFCTCIHYVHNPLFTVHTASQNYIVTTLRINMIFSRSIVIIHVYVADTN